METKTDFCQPMKLEEALRVLEDLLAREREAILRADVKTVKELSVEKENIAASIEDISLDQKEKDQREIISLAKKIGELALSNHAMLDQMQRYYHGMVEFFMRIAGQHSNYGPDGTRSEIGGLKSAGRNFTA